MSVNHEASEVLGGARLLKGTNQALCCAEQIDRRATICYQSRLQS